MKTITKEGFEKIHPVKFLQIALFKFEDLGEAAKQKAIDKYYENEDYPFLSDDLAEDVASQLEAKKVKHENLKVMYSLGYSQGDGLCFTGEFTKGGVRMSIDHNYRYYFASSVSFEFMSAKDGGQLDEETGANNDGSGRPSKARKAQIDKLKAIYFEIAKKAEKYGYSVLEYRMNFEEFADHCEANKYTFEADGTMNNG